MRYHEIVIDENAENDLNYVVLAREIVVAFQKFLKAHLKYRLVDIPGCEIVNDKARRTYIFHIASVCPGFRFRNLYIGLQCYPKGAAPNHMASFIQSEDGKSGIVLVNAGNGEIGGETGVYWMFNWEHVVHELVHYFDWRRFNKPSEWTKRNERKAAEISKRGPTDDVSERKRALDDQLDYFNSPKEMNAYYQQGVHRIFNELVKNAKDRERLKIEDPEWADFYRRSYLDDFTRFKDRFASYFDKNWRDHLMPERKKAFTRRLYKLFQICKSEWPDMRAIKKDLFLDNGDIG